METKIPLFPKSLVDKLTADFEEEIFDRNQVNYFSHTMILDSYNQYLCEKKTTFILGALPSLN